MNKLISFIALAAVASLMSSFPALATNLEFSKLKDKRSQITFPSYTPDDRFTLAEQYQLMYEQLYAHKEAKAELYGPRANITSTLQEIVNEARTTSDKELHTRLTQAFSRLRDIHTTYQLPRPYSCHSAFLPFATEQVMGRDGKLVAAVVNVRISQEILRLFPEATQIETGDLILKYNKQSPNLAAKAVEEECHGSNQDAAARRAFACLTYRSGQNKLLPESDSVEVTFQKRDGSTKTITFPWLVRTDGDCIAKFEGAIEINGIARGGLSSEKWNPERPEAAKKSKPLFLPVTTKEEGGDRNFKWGIIQNEGKSYGYLRIDSFDSEGLIDLMVKRVGTILRSKLSATEGLIIDVRENPGGLIAYAEGIVQHFSPNFVHATGYSLRASEANEWYFNQVPFNDRTFDDALRLAVRDEKILTEPIPFSSPTQINGLGQSYFKPVVVITNANCYSACEIFVAGMKDHAKALIIGEDSTTGGGGANMYSFKLIVDQLPKDKWGPFKELPNQQDMGFSWRRNFRTNNTLAFGKPIEDLGVESDITIKPTLEDITSNGAIQLQSIIRELARLPF